MMRFRRGTAFAFGCVIAAVAGTANAGVLDVNITGAFGNHNWDNSRGWDEGAYYMEPNKEWGWNADPDPTKASGWTLEHWIAGGPAKLRVEVIADADPDVTITKNLVNTTGFAWTGFTIDLNQVPGFAAPSVYPGSLGSSRFSSNATVNHATGASMSWSLSGTDTPVLPGESVSFFFTFNIPGTVVFEMVQTPVPTPGALGLLGLGGLVALRRRRAA